MLSTSQSLVVIGFIVATSVIASYTYERYLHESNPSGKTAATTDVRVIMKRSMGLFLMLVALPKLLNIQPFSAAFSRYDLLAGALPAYAGLYPFLEMALGAAWWRNAASKDLIRTYASTIVLMGVTLVGVLYALLHSQSTLECGCLGTFVHMPLSHVTVFETGGMLLMTSYLLWRT